MLYANGTGVDINMTKAIEYYKRAAELNNNDALFQLGIFYYLGTDDVKPNYVKAIEYWERAYKFGNDDARHELGNMFFYGYEGVEKDITRANIYLEKAIPPQIQTQQPLRQQPRAQQPLRQQPQAQQPQAQQPQIQVHQQQQNVPDVFPKDNFENFALKMRCLICRNNAVNMVINECGHLICSTCFNSLIPKRCPKCNTEPITVRRILYGGYKQKYLKYKNKYLELKNKIL